MTVDVKYIGQDNESSYGNYVYESGCVAKVSRALNMEQVEIDGVLVGNAGYKAQRRGQLTPESAAQWKKHCLDVMRYFEDTGQVGEVEVITETADGAMRYLVKFRDLITNENAEVATIPPWGL